MSSRFSAGHIILVTGASSGLGKATALRLCQDGATVIANGRDVERLEALKAEATYSGRMILAPYDLMEDPDSLPAWLMKLSRQYGSLSGLACCAGMDKLGSLAMLRESEATEIFKLNWLVPVLLAKGFTDRRVNSGPGAALLFIASIAALLPLKGHIAYASSKAALIAAMRDIALETGSRGMRANCISPGFIASPMNQGGLAAVLEMEKKEKELTPLGPGSAEDIAALASFLLSAEARWISGQNYIIDGGRS